MADKIVSNKLNVRFKAEIPIGKIGIWASMNVMTLNIPATPKQL